MPREAGTQEGQRPPVPYQAPTRKISGLYMDEDDDNIIPLSFECPVSISN
jgi:hypothetical protein